MRRRWFRHLSSKEAEHLPVLVLAASRSVRLESLTKPTPPFVPCVRLGGKLPIDLKRDFIRGLRFMLFEIGG